MRVEDRARRADRPGAYRLWGTAAASDSNHFAYDGAPRDLFASRTGRTTLRATSGLFGAAVTVTALPVTVAVGAAP